MRSAVSRRFVFTLAAIIGLGGAIPVARVVVHSAVAHLELARLNRELDAEATLEQDTMTPANWSRSVALVQKIHKARTGAIRPQAGTVPAPTLARRR